MAPASSKEFLDIQATVEYGFTLKLVRDMIKTYNQIYFQYLIFLCYSVFFTKLLTLGILFSTAVNAESVAKPVILGILLSISVVLAFKSVI